MNTIKKNGTRCTVELDESDCAVIASALKLAATTRDAGRMVVGKLMKNEKAARAIGPLVARMKESPSDDKRHAELIDLFDSASNHC